MNCKNCKKPFKVRPSWKKTRRTCCRKCHYQLIKKDSSFSSNYKGGITKKKNFCLDCNNQILYFSKRCHICENKRRKGKKSPLYNFSKTNKERIVKRKLICYIEWVNKVLKIFDYTCQNCYKRGYSLVVHHLEGYHWCKELRFDEKNGVCLCEKCHNSFHKRFGYKWNTSEQFYEFLNEVKYESQTKTDEEDPVEMGSETR